MSRKPELMPIIVESVCYTQLSTFCIEHTDARLLNNHLELIADRFNLDLSVMSHYEYANRLLLMQVSWN